MQQRDWYERLRQLPALVRRQTQAGSYDTSLATEEGIEAQLRAIFGNTVNIFVDATTSVNSIFDAEYEPSDKHAVTLAKEIAGHSSDQLSWTNHHYVDANCQLNKPLILIINDTSAHKQLAHGTELTGFVGHHWVAIVILPAQFQPAHGPALTNTQPTIFLVDSYYPNRSLPLTFKQAVISDTTMPKVYKDPYTAPDAHYQQYCRTPFVQGTQIVERLDAKQQVGGTACGFWTVYNAAMIVFTGDIAFLGQFQTRSKASEPILRNWFTITQDAAYRANMSARRRLQPKKTGTTPQRTGLGTLRRTTPTQNTKTATLRRPQPPVKRSKDVEVADPNQIKRMSGKRVEEKLIALKELTNRRANPSKFIQSDGQIPAETTPAALLQLLGDKITLIAPNDGFQASPFVDPTIAAQYYRAAAGTTRTTDANRPINDGYVVNKPLVMLCAEPLQFEPSASNLEKLFDDVILLSRSVWRDKPTGRFSAFTGSSMQSLYDSIGNHFKEVSQEATEALFDYHSATVLSAPQQEYYQLVLYTYEVSTKTGTLTIITFAGTSATHTQVADIDSTYACINLNFPTTLSMNSNGNYNKQIELLYLADVYAQNPNANFATHRYDNTHIDLFIEQLRLAFNSTSYPLTDNFKQTGFTEQQTTACLDKSFNKCATTTQPRFHFSPIVADSEDDIVASLNKKLQALSDTNSNDYFIRTTSNCEHYYFFLIRCGDYQALLIAHYSKDNKTVPDYCGLFSCGNAPTTLLAKADSNPIHKHLDKDIASSHVAFQLSMPGLALPMLLHIINGIVGESHIDLLGNHINQLIRDAETKAINYLDHLNVAVPQHPDLAPEQPDVAVVILLPNGQQDAKEIIFTNTPEAIARNFLMGLTPAGNSTVDYRRPRTPGQQNLIAVKPTSHLFHAGTGVSPLYAALIVVATVQTGSADWFSKFPKPSEQITQALRGILTQLTYAATKAKSAIDLRLIQNVADTLTTQDPYGLTLELTDLSFDQFELIDDETDKGTRATVTDKSARNGVVIENFSKEDLHRHDVHEYVRRWVILIDAAIDHLQKDPAIETHEKEQQLGKLLFIKQQYTLLLKEQWTLDVKRLLAPDQQLMIKETEKKELDTLHAQMKALLKKGLAEILEITGLTSKQLQRAEAELIASGNRPTHINVLEVFTETMRGQVRDQSHQTFANTHVPLGRLLPVQQFFRHKADIMNMILMLDLYPQPTSTGEQVKFLRYFFTENGWPCTTNQTDTPASLIKRYRTEAPQSQAKLQNQQLQKLYHFVQRLTQTQLLIAGWAYEYGEGIGLFGEIFNRDNLCGDGSELLYNAFTIATYLPIISGKLQALRLTYHSQAIALEGLLQHLLLHPAMSTLRIQEFYTLPSAEILRVNTGRHNYLMTSFFDSDGTQLFQGLRGSSLSPIMLHEDKVYSLDRMLFTTLNVRQDLEALALTHLKQQHEPPEANSQKTPIEISLNVNILMTPKRNRSLDRAAAKAFQGSPGKGEYTMTEESYRGLRCLANRPIEIETPDGPRWFKFNITVVSTAVDDYAKHSDSAHIVQAINGGYFFQTITEADEKLSILAAAGLFFHSAHYDTGGQRKIFTSKTLKDALNAPTINQELKKLAADIRATLHQIDTAHQQLHILIERYQSLSLFFTNDSHETPESAKIAGVEFAEIDEYKALKREYKGKLAYIQKLEKALVENTNKYLKKRLAIFSENFSSKATITDYLAALNSQLQHLEKLEKLDPKQLPDRITAHNVQSLRKFYDAFSLYTRILHTLKENSHKNPGMLYTLPTYLIIFNYTILEKYVEWFCKSGEDRTGTLEIFILSVLEFRQIYGRYPDLSTGTNDRETLDLLIIQNKEKSASQATLEENNPGCGGFLVSTRPQGDKNSPSTTEDKIGRLAKKVYKKAKSATPPMIDYRTPKLVSRELDNFLLAQGITPTSQQIEAINEVTTFYFGMSIYAGDSAIIPPKESLQTVFADILRLSPDQVAIIHTTQEYKAIVNEINLIRYCYGLLNAMPTVEKLALHRMTELSDKKHPSRLFYCTKSKQVLAEDCKSNSEQITADTLSKFSGILELFDQLKKDLAPLAHNTSPPKSQLRRRAVPKGTAKKDDEVALLPTSSAKMQQTGQITDKLLYRLYIEKLCYMYRQAVSTIGTKDPTVILLGEVVRKFLTKRRSHDYMQQNMATLLATLAKELTEPTLDAETNKQTAADCLVDILTKFDRVTKQILVTTETAVTNTLKPLKPLVEIPTTDKTYASKAILVINLRFTKTGLVRPDTSQTLAATQQQFIVLQELSDEANDKAIQNALNQIYRFVNQFAGAIELTIDAGPAYKHKHETMLLRFLKDHLTDTGVSSRKFEGGIKLSAPDLKPTPALRELIPKQLTLFGGGATPRKPVTSPYTLIPSSDEELSESEDNTVDYDSEGELEVASTNSDTEQQKDEFEEADTMLADVLRQFQT